MSITVDAAGTPPTPVVMVAAQPADGSVAERLRVDANGDAWLWVHRSTDPARAADVGTFRVRIPAARLKKLRGELASAPPRVPDKSPPPPSLVVWQVVKPGPDQSLQQAGPELTALLRDLRAKPLRVMRLGATVVGAANPRVVPNVASVGTEPVTVRLPSGSLTIGAQQPSGWTLVDATGTGHGGVDGPTALGPGQRFGVAVQPAVAGGKGVTVVARGRIAFAGPFAATFPAEGVADDQPFVAIATA